MGIVFKAIHPVFGRGTKALGLAYQQRSPYYWWWEFLRRNDAYEACCDAGGTGPLGDLYKDFGVVKHDTFKHWWTERGFYLFGEQPRPVKLHEVQGPREWESSWTKETVMVVAVPLDIPKRYLQRFFAALLKTRHSGKRGHKTLSDSAASTARYPLYRIASVETLRKQLEVYDAVMAKRRGENRRTLAKIGADLKLVASAMPNPKDLRHEAELKRNVMAATVSRYFKDAERIIANTTLGKFPKNS
jgi:hypothetical protein